VAHWTTADVLSAVAVVVRQTPPGVGRLIMQVMNSFFFHSRGTSNVHTILFAFQQDFLHAKILIRSTVFIPHLFHEEVSRHMLLVELAVKEVSLLGSRLYPDVSDG
jgi:hypothetical protein